MLFKDTLFCDMRTIFIDKFSQSSICFFFFMQFGLPFYLINLKCLWRKFDSRTLNLVDGLSENIVVRFSIHRHPLRLASVLAHHLLTSHSHFIAMNLIEICNVGEIFSNKFTNNCCIYAVLGVSLNLLLLFLIIKCSKPHLGNYKNLLKIFACNDIFMAIAHAIVEPV